MTPGLVRGPIPWGRWWLLAGALWTLNALLSALARGSMTGRAPTGLTFPEVVSSALWIPVTVFAFWLAHRFPLERRTWRRTIPLAIAAAALVIVARALFVVATNGVMHWYPVIPPLAQLLVTSIANNLLLFLLVLGAGHALSYARAVREREELLAQAELQYLKAQLHPHFLFNTLNTIGAYVRSEPDTAVQVIARLGTLLRHALQRAGTHEVSLEEELAIVSAYVEIEQLRFGERLHVTWQVNPETLAVAVPHLLLQPLVENAIRHGLSTRSAPGTLAIRTERDGERLRLIVSDDGVGLRTVRPERPASSTGVGLANVRQRLRQLYGDAQQLLLRERVPHGVEVTVSLPFRAFEHAERPYR